VTVAGLLESGEEVRARLGREAEAASVERGAAYAARARAVAGDWPEEYAARLGRVTAALDAHAERLRAECRRASSDCEEARAVAAGRDAAARAAGELRAEMDRHAPGRVNR
jgi:hypothetical protein